VIQGRSRPLASDASGPPDSGGPSGELPRVEPIPAISEPVLAAAFSQGLDLAEGKPIGHARRVCHVALSLADAFALPRETGLALCYASLLHDAGVAPASAELCRLSGVDEESLFAESPLRSPEEQAAELSGVDISAVLEVMRRHCEEGAEVAKRLGLSEETADAILCHHERWDGSGYPRGLAGQEIPIAGRILAVADLAESLISSEKSPLLARRGIASALALFTNWALDPDLVAQVGALARVDSFWLGLYGGGSPESLASLRPLKNGRKTPATLRRYAQVFAALADSKGQHTHGHSPRTALWAKRLAVAAGLSREHVRRVELAALLHHIGLLGVPARIMAKPDILTLAEMEVMRRHPSYSHIILDGLPGLEDVAAWVRAHHERPDGKGYPEMLEGDAIPLEAHIISLADTFVALTSERPYRRALSYEDAQQVLLGAAGSQLDEKLVGIFHSLAVEAA
jgi:HD-GYP domain-containing protein (c-di-GMP phosphodiesterase class II)